MNGVSIAFFFVQQSVQLVSGIFHYQNLSYEMEADRIPIIRMSLGISTRVTEYARCGSLIGDCIPSVLTKLQASCCMWADPLEAA